MATNYILVPIMRQHVSQEQADYGVTVTFGGVNLQVHRKSVMCDITQLPCYRVVSETKHNI